MAINFSQKKKACCQHLLCHLVYAVISMKPAAGNRKKSEKELFLSHISISALNGHLESPSSTPAIARCILRLDMQTTVLVFDIQYVIPILQNLKLHRQRLGRSCTEPEGQTWNPKEPEPGPESEARAQKMGIYISCVFKKP